MEPPRNEPPPAGSVEPTPSAEPGPGAADASASVSGPPTSASAEPGGVEPGGYISPGRPALTDELSPAAQRDAWTLRTGPRASYEVRAMATGLLQPDVPFSELNPQTGEIETGNADQLGIGGGLGLRAGLMYFSLPDQASPSAALTGFRLGVGLDGSVLYSKPPSGFTYRTDGDIITGRAVDRVDKAFFYPAASVQLGFHVGFGRYRTPSIWRGIVFGLAYSPAYVWWLEIGKTEFDDGGFNYGGVEATLDIVSIEASVDNVKSEMQIRLFALVLPKVNDELPWLISLGVGAAWY